MDKSKTKPKTKYNVKPKQDPQFNHTLAIMIILLSLGLLIVMTMYILAKSSDKDVASQTVTTAVLPLLGAWVGAVIAFYFSGKNLETATNSVRTLFGQMTSQEKLKTISVREKMIQRYEMFIVKESEAVKSLADILKALKESDKGLRIPVLDDQGRPKYIIHRSSIDKYLAERYLESVQGGKTSKDLTLADLINSNPELKTSFAVVSDKATLADAKDAMDKTNGCQDVFVTKNGTKDEEVVGWITNGTIADNSTV